MLSHIYHHARALKLMFHLQGKNCLTNFHGIGLTTNKLRSMVKK